MSARDYAEDIIAIVLQMYNIPASSNVPITPVLDEVEEIIIAAQSENLRLRSELIQQKQYSLELDRMLQTGEFQNAKIQG